MNALPTLVDSPAIERLGWTLLHSAWQGLIAALVLSVLLPTIRRRGARAAYAVCCEALLLTVLLPAATFCLLPSSPSTQTTTSVVSASATGRGPGDRPLRPNSMSPYSVDPTSATTVKGNDRISARQQHIAAPPRGSSEESSIAKAAASSAGTLSLQKSTSVASAWRGGAVTLWRHLSDRLASWLPWAVLAWTAGVLALSLWNIGGWFTARRLKSRGTSSVSIAIQKAGTRIAQQLGLTRSVRLLQSALVDSPVVIGAFKPVILLPASLLTQIPVDQLESLLAHELAHVVRHDYLVNLVQSVIETLLFYHPAVWWISAQVRAERENCCDDLAVAIAVDRAVYVRALASVAGARTSTMVPAATGGLLVSRLRRILGVVDPVAAHPSRWLTGVAILLLCGAAITVFALGSPPATAQVNAPKSEERNSHKSPRLRTSGRTQIQVLDEAAKPVPDALVNVEMVTEEGTRKVRDYQCDAQGRVTVDLSKSLDSLQLFVSKPGWLKDQKAFWANSPKNPSVIPETIQFQLFRPIDIGGIVTDEQRRPVNGARVQYRDGATQVRSEAVTDAKGRWLIGNVRPGAHAADQLDITHPDYLASSSLVDAAWKQGLLTFAELRSQTAVVVMHSGLAVTGKVTDPTGEPIERAPVLWGSGARHESAEMCLTNKDGEFRFRAKAPGPLTVTVFAQGWMPEQRAIVVAPGMRSTDFQLGLGKKLRMRFVDRAGKPVPGVGVILGRWHGFNSNPYLRELKLPFQADKNGVFEWDWAPDDLLTFDLIKPGYGSSEVHVTADGREQTQILNPLLHISGNVVDAKTGRPIDAFISIPVHYDHLDRAYVSRSDSQHCRAGRFDVNFDGNAGPDIFAH